MSAPRIKGLDGTTWRFVRVDALGQLVVAGGVSPATDAQRDDPGVAVASRVVSASATRPLQFEGRNTSAATRFFMVFNAGALPANGTAPSIVPFLVPASAQFSLVLEPSLFATGLVWAWSTTDLTLTLGGADGWVSTWHRP